MATQLVRQGRIEPGSVLIVESLDRLSREQVLETQALFLLIINAGVTIVTLVDLGRDLLFARDAKRPPRTSA
ncbi:recombinase family protein [Virgifigura deserti]|uniref:recombinase family protein n=1 Tax=Virgifigura deserti TaxID=2268457 RepID=UPI003CCBE149